MRVSFASLSILLLLACASVALAQTEPPRKSPFGTGPSATDARPGAATPAAPVAGADHGIVAMATGWLLETQRDLHRRLAGAVRAIGAENPVNATLFLMGLSFAYGVFHAAGPGHGKAVIASYVLANERTVRRGIQLSFLAALFQAISALVLVAGLGLLFNVTGMKRRMAEAWIETASWGLVALLGAWLLYGQVRRMLLARGQNRDGHGHSHIHEHAHDHDHGHAMAHAHAHAGPGHTHRHDADQSGHHHAHTPHTHAHHAHHHSHDEHGACCDHAHMPEPQQLEGAWSWRKASAMAFAIGIRPCTGAIVVLVFAISQGLLWAGVLSTFAMALGTAITVSALAALAVGSRELAARIAGRGSSSWANGVRNAAGLLGASAVLVLGALFCWASINNPSPF